MAKAANKNKPDARQHHLKDWRYHSPTMRSSRRCKAKKARNSERHRNPCLTATIIELFIAQQPIVEIDTIDEFGQPWFTVSISINGQLEEHILAMMDEDSWELVNDRKY